MPNYRRSNVPGATYFFTLVTDGRAPIFDAPIAAAILRRTASACRRRWPWETIASVVLPDHLHAIWSLPPGDSAFGLRLGWIKKEFTKSWLAAGAVETTRGRGRTDRRRRGVWQPRFWEHLIRDDGDLERHVAYVLYNPVRHGLVTCPHDWPSSSFHRLVRQGRLGREWACQCESAVPAMRFDDIARSARE